MGSFTVEIVLSGFALLVAWLSLTNTAREDASSYERRLRNIFVISSGKTKTYTNNKNDEIGVSVDNVVFEEKQSWSYFLKRTFWPWQDVQGTAKFNVRIEGMKIEDMDAFRDSMPGWGEITPCTNDAHENHYYVNLDNSQSDIQDAFDREGIYGYELFFHYFANSGQVEYTDET